jgi:hypothetical protein
MPAVIVLFKSCLVLRLPLLLVSLLLFKSKLLP